MHDHQNLTFLFTDIEGSTSKWEEQPEQMAQAVAQHDSLLRDAVEAHRGASSRRRATVSMPPSKRRRTALARSIDIQLALLDPAATGGMGLRIRCGLHTGPVQSRDNDYFGSTINRTARIMNAAHGGQILVSSAIADSAARSAARRSVAQGTRQRPAEGARDLGGGLPGRAPEALPEFPGAARARGDAEQSSAAADVVHRPGARAGGYRGDAGRQRGC